MVHSFSPSKALTLFTAALAAAILTFSSPATAQTPGRGSRSDGEASASFGYFSNLVWRGQELNTGASFQPMADVAWKGFGFNIWTNFDVDKGYINETDYTLNYSGGRNKLGYDVGVIYYGLRSPTTELYFSLKYDVILAPYATFYWDIDAGQGGFLIVGIRQPFAVSDGIDVALSAYVSANFGNKAMGFDQNGKTFTDFYNMDLKANTIIPLADAWAFDILLAYSFPLSDAAKSGISGASATGKHNVFYGGVALTLAF